MRVLVAGNYLWRFYEPEFCEALRASGADVVEFRALDWMGPGKALRYLQLRVLLGPGVLAANLALLARARRHAPDLVLAWSTPWLLPGTIRALRRMGCRVVVYTNDDPFGPDARRRQWRCFRRLIPAADACACYRAVNLGEYRRAAARRAFLLRSWYSPGIHRPLELTAADHERFGADVVFVGHYEPDGRLDALSRLVDAGLAVRVFGGGWSRAGRRASDLFGSIAPVMDDDYVRAILAAKVALVFLSRRNRDQYTRRCFEIPAMGALMLAPRTDELLAMYDEDREAMYFGSTEELVQKAERCVRDPDLRASVAAAGRARCLRDGHDVTSRASQFLRDVADLAP